MHNVNQNHFLHNHIGSGTLCLPASLHRHEHELKEKLSYPKTVEIKIKVKNRNHFKISTVENKK